MKKIISFLFLFLLWNTTQASERVLLTGKVKQATFPMAKIVHQTSVLNGASVTYEVDLDANGEFTFLFPMEQSGLATLHYGGEYVELFLQPGDQFGFSFEEGAILASIRFSGAGQGAVDNNFLNAYYRKFGILNRENAINIPPQTIISQEIYDIFGPTDPTIFQHYTLQKEEEEKSFLAKNIPLFRPSYAVQGYINRHVNYRWALYRLLYPEFYRGKQPLPDGYFNYLQYVKTRDTSALNHLDYVNFLDRYVGHLHIQENKKQNRTEYFVDELYYLIREKFEGKLRDFCLARLLVVKCNSKNIEDLAPLFNDFFEISTEDAYRIAVVETVRKYSQFSELAKAADFELVNLEGDSVALSDFSGKIVYLSFWASWCKPCIQDIHDSRENFVDMAASENMVLVHVSIDNKEERWRAAVEKNEIPGIQLWAGPNRDTQVEAAYEVLSLPTHYLIDQDGSFIPDFPPTKGEHFIDFLVKHLKNN